jgi:hypothetical protein
MKATLYVITYLLSDKSVTDYPGELISPHSDEPSRGLHPFGRRKKYAWPYPGQIPQIEGILKFGRRWRKFRYHSLNKPQAYSCYR